MLLLQQMLVLFIYIVIGYAACKNGILNNETGDKLSWLVINIANPGMIISAVVNGDGIIKGKDLAFTAVLAAVIFAFLIFIAQFIPYIFRFKKDERNIYKLMAAFNNIGFMGYPVIVAAYGEEALLYAVIFSIEFNIIIYTYGVSLVRKTKEKIAWSKLFNVGTVSSIIAIILYLTELQVPMFVKNTSSGLSNLTAPLSMMVVGISLAGMNLKELFTDIKLLLYSLVKLLVIPIPMMLVINQFVQIDMLRGVCMVVVSTPAASLCAMFAHQYKNNYELATKGVAITTVLSVITIPMVSAVVF